MDGIELGREVSRLRTEQKIEAGLGVLRRGQPEAASATGADCAIAAKEPLRRLEALRRRQVPVPMRWAARPTATGRFAFGR